MKKVLVGRSRTLVTLANGRTLELGPYVYIRKGDVLEFSPGLRQFKTIQKVFTDRATGRPARVVVYPSYCRTEIVSVPPHTLRITFKERAEPRDWRAARLLEHFHYRGKGFNRIVGRRVALVAECQPFGVLAYGVLSATVPMARPRFQLFGTNFTQQMRTGLINRIARIPRIVVHPEFRGMGLGVLMAKHLIQYARTHWDINGYKPILVEVIAKMTEYHRFFEKTGFMRLGDTEGYENGMIPQYGNGTWEKRNFQRFDFTRNQKGKPYLVWPLSAAVRSRVALTRDAMPSPVALARFPKPAAKPMGFRNVTISYKVANGHSLRSRIVKDAFGVDASQLETTVIRDLSLVVEPGDVVLVTGASGCGKSTLLRPISTSLAGVRSRMQLRGRVNVPGRREVAVLTTEFESDKPLVEQVCKRRNVRYAIELLNSVGLAEAHLYLKSPRQISDGQRYRFAVARLCDSGKPVWVADEFASTLSPEIAAVVAKGLRRLGKKHGATMILAAPHVEHFADSLLANKLIRLSWGGVATILALRAQWHDEGSRIGLALTNTSPTPLSGVVLEAVDLKGSATRLAALSRLEPCAEWCAAVGKGRLGDAVCLRVRCQQGVGDIAYLDV